MLAKICFEFFSIPAESRIAGDKYFSKSLSDPLPNKYQLPRPSRLAKGGVIKKSQLHLFAITGGEEQLSQVVALHRHILYVADLDPEDSV